MASFRGDLLRACPDIHPGDVGQVPEGVVGKNAALDWFKDKALEGFESLDFAQDRKSVLVNNHFFGGLARMHEEGIDGPALEGVQRLARA